ncbi:MAG: VWA domain-containing protein [Anaerolineales bacterium]|nr:VWA domain-containing protein [Anaerolineales bacterium]
MYTLDVHHGRRFVQQALSVCILVAVILAGGGTSNPARASQAEPAPAFQGVDPCAPPPGIPDFVTVNNGHFSLGGQPFRHVGVNEVYLLYYIGYTDPAVLGTELDELEDLGIKQVRVFLPDSGHQLDNYKERIRWALDEAKKRGIRLTIVLDDYYGRPNVTGDYMYFPGEGNRTIRFEGGLMLDDGWFDENGGVDVYKGFVEDVVQCFQADDGIFAWEIGNEIKYNTAGHSQDLVNFYTEIARIINTNDPNHLVTTGIASTDWALIEPIDANTLYSDPNIDYITIHAYNGEIYDPSRTNDVAVANNVNKPFVIEEIGASLDYMKSKYPDDQEIDKFQAMRDLYQQAYGGLGADAVLHWGVELTGEYGFGDSVLGMQRELLEEYKSLWQCRAASLENANNGVNKIDLWFQRLEWKNLTSPDAPEGTLPSVGDTVRFEATICNAGDVATDKGIGVNFFLDNNGQNPVIMHTIGNVYDVKDIQPGDQATIAFDWTVVDPSSLDARITAQNAVLVGLVDDVNRYPDEITEENNGHAIDFPVNSATNNVDVVLIIDSSGSMGWNDPSNKRLDAGKAYLAASLAGDYVGVVDFNSYASLDSPLVQLPENRTNLIAAIDGIGSSGGTDVGAGVQAGCDALIASPSSNDTKAAILLTDGQGPFDNQDACFKDQGWKIYTFGFGDSDDALLQQIATNTGGDFKRLPTSDLVCEFQQVRAKIAGQTPVPCTTYNVSPEQTISFNISVPAGQQQATFSTSWAGSDVVMSLTTPSGRVISRDTVVADVFHEKGAAYEVYTIKHPEPGDWVVSLFGADVPSEGEDVVFGLTTLPDTTPDDTTPPVITPTITGTLGLNGWYTSDVVVSWSVQDLESGISSSSGCDTTTFTTDTTDVSLTCSATNGTALTSTASTTVKLDKTAPAITISSPQAQAYTHTETIDIAWDTSDSTSGVDTDAGQMDGNPVTNGQQADLFLMALGPHTITVTASDQAGNTSSQSVEFDVTATIESLMAAVERFHQDGSIDHRGVYYSLMQQLRAAAKSNKPEITSNILNAFIYHVKAQRDKHIAAQAADLLVADAKWVITHLQDTAPPYIHIKTPRAIPYPHAHALWVDFDVFDSITGVKEISATLDDVAATDHQRIDLHSLTLGEHVLTVNAVDYAGNESTKSVTFKVVVTIQSLKANVASFYIKGDIDSRSIYYDLLKKLMNAENSRKPAWIISALNSFIQKVQQQSGQHITPEAANELITDAQWLIEHTK